MPEFLPESHRPLATLAAAFQAGVVKRVDREGLIFHHLFFRAIGVLGGQSLQSRSQIGEFRQHFFFRTYYE